jgi:drug/metabolite transporter (DMT)-like permease
LNQQARQPIDAAAAERPSTVSPGTAYLFAAAAMIVYSSPPVVTRAVYLSVPPLALSLSRWAIALVVLLPLAWRRLPREWPKVKRQWPSLVFVASLMVAGSTMSVLAVYFTTATNAVLVNASQPAITATMAWAIGRMRLAPTQRIGIACAFAGIVVMIARADLNVLLGLELNIGDLIMLLAVIGWSSYAVLLPRRDYIPDGITLMFVIALTGTVLLAPASLIEAAYAKPFELQGEVLGAMLYLAIFPTLLATTAWNVAIRSIGPNRTAIFVNLIPVAGAAMATLFLGEQLHTYHLIGAAFVLAGIWLAVRRR